MRGRSLRVRARVGPQVQPGQALLIVGQSGCGKSSLLRACAGLWAPAAGRIALPAAGPDGGPSFLPQMPYMPLEGTLRAQLLWPKSAGASGEAEARLLEVVRLVRLDAVLERVGGLDAHEANWASRLSAGEQQVGAG